MKKRERKGEKTFCEATWRGEPRSSHSDRFWGTKLISTPLYFFKMREREREERKETKKRERGRKNKRKEKKLGGEEGLQRGHQNLQQRGLNSLLPSWSFIS